jgi:hypothetical protein
VVVQVKSVNKSSQVKSSQVKSSQVNGRCRSRRAPPPSARGRAARSCTRAGALTSLGACSGGALGLSTASHYPLELAEILHTALQLLCHRQVQHTIPNTKNEHRG